MRLKFQVHIVLGTSQNIENENQAQIKFNSGLI